MDLQHTYDFGKNTYTIPACFQDTTTRGWWGCTSQTVVVESIQCTNEGLQEVWSGIQNLPYDASEPVVDCIDGVVVKRGIDLGEGEQDTTARVDCIQ